MNGKPIPFDEELQFWLTRSPTRLIMAKFREVLKGEILCDGDWYLNSRGTYSRCMTPGELNTGWTLYIRPRVIGSAKIPKKMVQSAKIKKV